MAQRRAAAPSTYHSLLPAGTPPLLPIPLPAPSTSRRADIPEANSPPRKRLLLTASTPRFEVGKSSAAAARQPGSTMARRVDHSFVDTVNTRVRDTKQRTMAAVKEDRAGVRAEIEILRRERLAYEQESIETHQALARSESYNRALEAQIRVLETQAYCHKWQRQDVDDRAIKHIMRIQALEAGARVDTLEDTEAIAKYESINQTKQRENKVAGNASNKRKWEGDHNRSSNQQHKGHKVFRAHAVGPNNKKYVGSIPLCNKCKCHHNGPYTVKYGKWKKKYAGTLPLCTMCNYHHKVQCAPKCNICKKIGHLAQNCRTPADAEYQRTLTYYECGGLGHYKRDCPELKNQNNGNQAGSTEASEMVHALGGETNQDIDNLEDYINA
ncbi:reverse transcriptase domain-containing protein [Tanacetum coccineum]